MYPGGIKDFFKSPFPEGYTQNRTITFENDGKIQTEATLTLHNGNLVNKIKLVGKDFNEDGHVMKKTLGNLLPSNEWLMPLSDGLRGGVICVSYLNFVP